MVPGLELLRRLRVITVIEAECRTSPSGVVRAAVVVALAGGKIRKFGPTTPVLRMAGGDLNKTITDAQGVEVQRVSRDVEAALAACPEWQAELGRRAGAAAERAIRGRADVIADGAVRHGVPRERLLQVVGEAWDLHAVRQVMES